MAGWFYCKFTNSLSIHDWVQACKLADACTHAYTLRILSQVVVDGRTTPKGCHRRVACGLARVRRDGFAPGAAGVARRLVLLELRPLCLRALPLSPPVPPLPRSRRQLRKHRRRLVGCLTALAQL
eukprot:scaffold99471_cov51-Phaeocystis_antarctica.AAC.2